MGVLGFLYNSDNEQLEIEYVRVRKAGGSVVETPNSSALDVATEVATTAPTYSDLRQKQIPVKALGVGDVLEYSVRSWQRKPEVPGQFWYQQILIDDAVVLNQSLEIRVPKDKYVQVSSPKLKSETREEGDQRVYVWKHSHLEPSKPDDKKKQFISGSDFLKNAAHAIQTAKYDFAFPDEGPEKIIRRGILSCSNFTKPSCQLTLLLPSTVRKDSKPN